MKITKFYILFFAAAIMFITLTAYNPKTTSLSAVFKRNAVNTDNKDIIKFDHGFHIKEAGLACKDCHYKAWTSDKASDNLNPVKKDCATCHDVNDNNNCNYCHYGGVYKKLRAADRELIFSHRFHVGQKMECTDCHSGLDKVKYASDSPGGFADMESCYKCHDSRTAAMNCEGCHTNLTSLKPKDHLNSNFLNEHTLVYNPETGKKNDNCMMCHSSNFCEVCHQPVTYTGDNTIRNFYAPYYTKDFATRTDREALQKLTTVHSLNYLYNHGMDARQKSFECKTCHDPVEYCTACHQNGGNLQTGMLPKSHVQPNFVTFGVNTGGGIHAELAKRDIESCESCHSVQGGDPACIKCHIDNDGIKGTNPKTHETGFMNDENGNWHDTQGSICYRCHIDPNARPNGISGVGFCGYCHGK